MIWLLVREPAQAELVEALPFFCAGEERQPFDKLRVSGLGSAPP